MSHVLTFLEAHSFSRAVRCQKTVHFSEQIMSHDKFRTKWMLLLLLLLFIKKQRRMNEMTLPLLI